MEDKNEDLVYSGIAVIAIVISCGVGLILGHWLPGDVNSGICILLFVGLSMIFVHNYEKKKEKRRKDVS